MGVFWNENCLYWGESIFVVGGELTSKKLTAQRFYSFCY